MKIALVMLMCSTFHGCLEPFTMPTTYDTYYDCLQAGYDEAINKQKEIGELKLISIKYLLGLAVSQ